MNLTLEQAEKFLQSGPLAVVGVSSTGKRFGAMVFRTLLQDGRDVIPVNPKIERFDGNLCYNSISSMEKPPSGVIFVTRPENTIPALEECRELGVCKVWFQPGSQSEEALRFCRENGIEAHSGFCILLFSKSFPHNLHLFILKLIGKLK